MEKLLKVVEQVIFQKGSSMSNPLLKDREELRQELILKALEVADRYSDLPEEEIKKIIYSSLRNYIVNLNRDSRWEVSFQHISLSPPEETEDEENGIQIPVPEDESIDYILTSESVYQVLASRDKEKADFLFGFLKSGCKTLHAYFVKHGLNGNKMRAYVTWAQNVLMDVYGMEVVCEAVLS